MLTLKSDKKKFDKFIEENLPLVGYVISKYFPSVLGTSAYEDYYQCGAMGLVYAARNFDPKRGYAFSTYAISIIHGYMLKNLWEYETNRIKTPRNIKSLHFQISKLKNEDLSDSEICSRLNISPEKLQEAVGIFSSIMSFDHVVHTGSDGTEICLKDTVPDNGNFTFVVEAKLEYQEKMKLLYSLLNEKEKVALELCFIHELKQKEVADILKVSKETVSKLVDKVKKKAAEVNRLYDGEITQKQFEEMFKKNPARKKKTGA